MNMTIVQRSERVAFPTPIQYRRPGDSIGCRARSSTLSDSASCSARHSSSLAPLYRVGAVAPGSSRLAGATQAGVRGRSCGPSTVRSPFGSPTAASPCSVRPRDAGSRRHLVRYNPGILTPDSDLRADVILLERIVARDALAVGDLYDRHHRLLFGLILRILKDRSEAEEVLQEVFVQVWLRAEWYNAALGSPAGWLVRVARNRAIDRLRANAARARALDAAPAPAPAENPETFAAHSEQQRSVARALDALPHDQRELIGMHRSST